MRFDPIANTTAELLADHMPVGSARSSRRRGCTPKVLRVEVEESFASAEVEWRGWVNGSFLFNSPEIATR